MVAVEQNSLTRLRAPRGSASVLTGIVIVSVIVVLAIFAPLIAPYTPNESSMDIMLGASLAHPLGTDELGRDTLSRIIYGARASLVIGIGAALVGAVIGLPIGLMAGFFGGRVDAMLSYLINLFVALPNLILALIITAIIGASLTNIVLVLGFVSWPQLARLVRGQTLAIREKMYVEAAVVAGASSWWILRRHIEPNTRRLVWSQLSLTIAESIFTASSLSFLGLGLPPPDANWGSMVRSGVDFLAIEPLMALAPSVAVAITITGFYMIGKSQR